MSTATDVEFSLKVMVNRHKTKVLFAEADSDFTDVLLSFLTLPLGTIVNVLENHYIYGDKAPYIVGSLTTLYKGLSDLDDDHFWNLVYDNKFMLLYPTSSLEAECVKLKINVHRTQQITNNSTFGDRNCKRKRNVRESKTQDVDDGGGFTRNTATLIISDDLQIAPVVPGSIVRTLIDLGITDTDGAELRTLTLGYNEVMDLLAGSLISKTPLTDLIFRERGKMDCVTGNLPVKVEKGSSSNSKKIIVKAMVQKSTNKILFAEAEEDFIEFLFSFLTIPLGGVVCLLGNNTSLNNIDNLYRSIAKINGDKYLKSKDTKAMLLKPKLPHYYISKNQILPLIEKALSTSTFGCVSKRKENCVQEQTMYKVTDDLIVTPFCVGSSFSILSRLKIPLSDVKEVELEIGLEEALRILKASLTSTSALTNGLMNNPISKKQPKQGL